MEYLIKLVLLFFFYAFIGWCMEVVLKYIQYHRFINRGFLAGPICPIYGVGAVLITVFVGGIYPIENAYGTTFVISFVICGLVEYVTSYVQEKLFHARWWDYSQKPMNLHGRIWIGNLILFGIGGVVIIHVGNPLFYSLVGNFSQTTLKIVSAVLLVVFIIDCSDTHFILKLVKKGITHSEADNTEEIHKEMVLLFSDKNIFYQRFIDAYPEVVYRTEKIEKRIETIRQETERYKVEAEQRYAELSKALESPTVIRNRIIQKQNSLIELMYDENHATHEEKEIRKEILDEIERLNERSFTKIPIISEKPTMDE